MSDAQASVGGKPKTVRELVQAWHESGRKAARLQTRLREVASHAKRYRKDLVRLAEQSQSRKQQAEDLQTKLLYLLDRQEQAPPDPRAEEVLTRLEELGDKDEQIPAEYARVLLRRLHESQNLIAEYETLLRFRENQVHEMLSRLPAQGSPPASEFILIQLKNELSQARSRIRLLTQELVRSQGPAVGAAPLPEGDLSAALREKDAQIAQLEARGQQLQEALQAKLGELQKAAATIQAAKGRIEQLEQARPPGEAGGDEQVPQLLEEVSALQDEVNRLHEENEQLRVDAEALDRTDELAALEAQIDEFHAEQQNLRDAFENDKLDYENRIAQAQAERNAILQAVQGERAQLDARLKQLEADNARLAAAGGGGGGDNSERTAKLEAAVVDLRAKLQLAASKYQEVKTALIDKHKQLQDWQNRSVESDKKSDFTVNVVQTLEAALGEARGQAEAERKKVADLEMRLASERPAEASMEGAAGGDATLEAKLKEARRSAVRAQAEAGLKRKEAAKLQEDLEQARAALKAAQEKLEKAGIS